MEILEKSVDKFEESFKGEDLSEDIKAKFDTVSGVR